MAPLTSLLFRPWLTFFLFWNIVNQRRQPPPSMGFSTRTGGHCNGEELLEVCTWSLYFKTKNNVSQGRNKRLVNGLEDSRRGSHHTSRNSCADVWLGPTKLLLFSVQAQGHFMKELFSVHWKSWWISAGFCHSRWRVSKWILWTEKTIAIRSVYRGHF